MYVDRVDIQKPSYLATVYGPGADEDRVRVMHSSDTSGTSQNRIIGASKLIRKAKQAISHILGRL